jgi:glucokinase
LSLLSDQRVTNARTIAPFLAADIGGTHARIALVGLTLGKMEIVESREYRCADHPSLSQIFAVFMADMRCEKPAHCALAIAGFLQDGVVMNGNLPWRVSIAALRAELDIQFSVVNDFAAVGHALPWIDPVQMTALTGDAREDVEPDAPMLVVGPGTGLGAAIRYRDGDHVRVYASEAGQSAFAPGNTLEIEVLRILQRRLPRVSIEDVVSGRGIVNLYTALSELRGEICRLNNPWDIGTAALMRSDPLAKQTLQIFCELLGSFVGDLVLIYGAHGGVYLAGGILPRIRPVLMASDFMQRFVDKGWMRPALERVPVQLIEHGLLGVVGAAGWFIDQQSLLADP